MIGFGILVTVFAAAGSGAHATRDLLAQRVSASRTAAAALIGLALVVTLVAHPRKRTAEAPETLAEKTAAA